MLYFIMDDLDTGKTIFRKCIGYNYRKTEINQIRRGPSKKPAMYVHFNKLGYAPGDTEIAI